jgi:formylglycine-generating enzyme required for sulfatase activity
MRLRHRVITFATLVLVVPMVLVGCRDRAANDQPSKETPSDKGQKVRLKDLPKGIINSIGMKLVLIPAGKFTMGSPKEEKDRSRFDEEQHEVELTKPYYLGVYEVTQGQFKKVMGYNPSFFSTDGQRKKGVEYERGGPAGGKQKVKGLDTSDFPVENVSWEEAAEFCKKLSALEKETAAGRVYRLPTSAEWEYACRAGASPSTQFHTGKTLSSEQANFDASRKGNRPDLGSSLGRTCKVGSYKPNAWGLYDMHGNVFEWCSDWCGAVTENAPPPGPQRDPVGPSEGAQRVLRGGCWESWVEGCRTAFQGREEPHERQPGFGFRVVMVQYEK